MTTGTPPAVLPAPPVPSGELIYRLLIEHSTDLIALLGAEGQVQYLSPSVHAHLGYNDSCDSVANKFAYQLVHREDWPTLIKRIHDTRPGGRAALEPFRVRHAYGHWCWMEGTVVNLLEHPDIRANLLAVRDVTETVRVKAELLARTQEYTDLLESITDAFYVLDRDWRFVYVNTYAQRLLGKSAEELLGQVKWEVFPESVDSLVGIHYREAMRSGVPQKFEVHYEPLELWAEAHLYPSARGLSVSFQDISARKATERAERQRSRILELTVQGTPLEQVLHEVALLVEQQCPGVLCSVLLRQEDRLFTAAAPSLPDTYSRAIDGLLIGPDQGSCGTSAFSREPVVTHDIAASPAWAQFRELAGIHGLCSCMSLPVLDEHGEVLGTFALYERSGAMSGAAHMDQLVRARDLAALAMRHHQLTAQLRHQAQHDALTGLPNRSLFTERLAEILEQSERSRASTALLFVDLDEFKGVNDTVGHHVGDYVLQAVADRLLGCARRGDVVARVGGDEFTLVLPFAEEPHAITVARRVLNELTRPFVVQGRAFHLGASIGISVSPQAGRDGQTLLRHADLAMYRAKREKSGFAVFEAQLNQQAQLRLQLASDLREALREPGANLELHYQPQVRLHDGQVVGAEALVRWRHPHLGMVSPAQFIPVAEDTGMIVPLGTWVMEEACRQAVAWAAAGHGAMRVAVNVSALQFARPDFVDTVSATLRATGLEAGRLEVELTESAVMEDVKESVERMERLRALGVSVAVDDFGTGYSSLSYLQRLPLNVLKIDRTFIQNLGVNATSRSVVQAIVGLAQHLNLECVAEGVETPDEREALIEVGCRYAQGFFFAKPLPAPALLEWLSQADGAR
ncbi:EAL domain-containing protein [Deinococcus deserti]|uniref:Putative diguanylate-cyclase n=1 Tax=Deinococcus deserti (strain DSM 17065 / CIP 109153 / LMG 22923 / VCD115) TaxID=546414 RepID=C1D1W4_DEIDV|nr:EAL domain-containing protein [Deinococcus deserti]ACO47403.1 putative diguanylate-cyclase [Deinococcus deserti VCD115]